MLSQKVRPLLSRKELLTSAIEMFKQQLKPMKILMKAYNIFIQNVLLLYKSYYPEKTDITRNNLKTPWITTGIKKSSKCKQRLYEKFLKNQNSLNESKNENNYLIQCKKKLHYSNLVTKYKICL